MKLRLFRRDRSLDNDPDIHLMLRFKAGDETAFEEIVEKFKVPIFNFVLRQLGNPTEAEDIAQNVFVRVSQSAASYQPTAKFTTWLFTIARNLCLNEFRRQNRHPAVSLHEPSMDGADSEPFQVGDPQGLTPPEIASHREYEDRILAAIHKLPENQRTALILCRYEEQPYDEIARVLGMTVSAVKSLLHRARETLKVELKDLLDKT